MSRPLVSLVLIASGTTLSLLGCTVGPDYAQPTFSTPASFAGLDERPATGEGGSFRAVAAPADVASWWSKLNDTTLNAFVQRGLERNLDVLTAASRVREARAALGIAEAGDFPTLDVSAGYTRSRSSGRTNGAEFNPGSSEDQSLWQYGFDTSWEIDFFGRVRREKEAAIADLASSEEARRAILVTLVSDIAQNYVQFRGFQARIDVANRNINAQRETLELTSTRAKAGLANELDVARARAQLENRRAILPSLESQLRAAAYRLSVLLVEEPAKVLAELSSPAAIPTGPSEIPVGLPSDLLSRRPDVRQAERALAAATARIGVAEADLYPRFSITGNFGFAASDFSEAFDMKARSWSIGPSVRWNIFDGGRIRSNIKVQNERAEQAALAYRKAVLGSIEEVENALSAFTQEQSRLLALRAAADASRKAAELALERNKGGLVAFLDVLEAQRTLFDAQDALTQSEQAVATNLVRLYKALGGGWDASPASESAGTSPTGTNGAPATKDGFSTPIPTKG
ncbi:MAG: efflux transporter outer membrane subunit [Planctomycetota bacterium]|nr:efflux transporter outer membrane subunit [Planctomycetota bacterium]